MESWNESLQEARKEGSGTGAANLIRWVVSLGNSAESPKKDAENIEHL